MMNDEPEKQKSFSRSFADVFFSLTKIKQKILNFNLERDTEKSIKCNNVYGSIFNEKQEKMRKG